MTTRQEVTGERNLDFSLWCRKNLKDAQAGLTLHDLDFVFSNFKTGYFICCEIKTNCIAGPKSDSIRFTQKAVLKMIDEMFFLGSKVNENTKEVRDLGSKVPYKYLGLYILSFSKTCPDNSEKIYINNFGATKEELVQCLNLDTTTIVKYYQRIK